MRARRTGVRSRPSFVPAAGAAAIALVLTACGGSGTDNSAGGGSQPDSVTEASGAPAATTAPGGAPAASAATGKSAAPRTSASAGAGASAVPSAAGGSTGGNTGSTTGSSPQPPSSQAPKAMSVNTKCRKPASSVGTGVAVKGQKPPPFSGTTLDCGSLDFASYTNGKPTLVNFFASWCEPCHKEAKDLEAVYEEYHDSKGFQIVGVETQDENGSPSWFYNQAHWTFPSVWDDKEKIEKAWNSTGVISTLPASFWIHPDGTISSTIVGEMSRSQMEDEFNKL